MIPEMPIDSAQDLSLISNLIKGVALDADPEKVQLMNKYHSNHVNGFIMTANASATAASTIKQTHICPK